MADRVEDAVVAAAVRGQCLVGVGMLVTWLVALLAALLLARGAVSLEA